MLKYCLKCDRSHSKKGKFCSRQCANSRTWTEEQNKQRAEKMNTFYNTPEGAIEKENKSQKQIKRYKCTDERNKQSNALTKFWEGNTEARNRLAEHSRNRIWSNESRKKLSKIAKKRRFGGHTSKMKLYFEKSNGEVVYLQSSYEILAAEILEKLNIEWSRPDPLPWIDNNGEDHLYYPDFKVNDIFIDTKNDYLIKKDAEKIRCVKEQNQVQLLVLAKEQITEEYIGSLV